MEIIGIVGEYNPFHNGHIYHIKKIKELYSDSLIILVLNGYFLERGEVSLLTKEDKTCIALSAGIDLVVELPFIFGSQAADIFALNSLKILNTLGAKKIIFGSECNDIEKLKKIAEAQNNENFNILVKNFLDEGINYPTALAKAINIDFEFTPNDLLGISYIKAIINESFDIEPITIKRTNNYHDTISNDSIISASNIRKKLEQNLDIDNYLPNYSKEKINTLNKDLLFKLIKLKITTSNDLSKYLDVDEGIEYRLKKCINTSQTLDEFITKIKTKRYTYNKINRMLIHILVGLEKNHQYRLEYIKVLGFNDLGQNYLNKIKSNLVIPITIDKQSLQYLYELKASIVHDLIFNTNTYNFELSTKPKKTCD